MIFLKGFSYIYPSFKTVKRKKIALVVLYIILNSYGLWCVASIEPEDFSGQKIIWAFSSLVHLAS